MGRMCLWSLLLLAAPAWAQTTTALSGCQAAPEIRRQLHDSLEVPAFDRLTFQQQETLRRTLLTNLIARYPREFTPRERLIAIQRREEEALHPGSWRTVQAGYRQQAAEHPSDPLVLAVAAEALKGTDTPESLRLLQAAKAQAPQFAVPDLELAEIYSSGKYADKAKFDQHLAAYWTLCPASTDGFARWMLAKNLALQAQVAAVLRMQLVKAKDPETLKGYQFLWSLEFRTHVPQEHDAVRRQVAADVQRLKLVEPRPDAPWMSFLLEGDRASGASEEEVHAAEDRLIQQYPHSHEAEEIVEQRWYDTHKAPTDQKDTAAWRTYRQASRAELQVWLRQYPDDMNGARFGMISVEYDDDTLPEREGIALVDRFLALAETQDQPGWIWSKYQAAEFLLAHRWQPARAAALLQQVAMLRARDEAQTPKPDNQTAEEEKSAAEQQGDMDRSIRSQLIQAALLAREPAAVASLQAGVNGDAPESKAALSGYWLDRARFAVLQGQRQDALSFYQQALQTRASPPTWQRGRYTDDVMDESRTLWSELGGTQTAFTVWSKIPVASTPTTALEARWEKPTKVLPAFQLTDLSGKTWTTATLKGKAVLINLWATWCGPCNAELPQLEKLYEQVKDRQDIQILTFNIDEDESLVAPYLKRKGYTFPVLPAYSYTVSLLDGYAIPQNWVLNGEGTWRWTQIGFDSDDHWQDNILSKLASTRSEAKTVGSTE